MASYHKAKADVIKLSQCDHFHPPAEEMPVFVGIGSVVEEAPNPRMASSDCLKMTLHNRYCVVGIFGPIVSSKSVMYC